MYRDQYTETLQRPDEIVGTQRGMSCLSSTEFQDESRRAACSVMSHGTGMDKQRDSSLAVVRCYRASYSSIGNVCIFIPGGRDMTGICHGEGSGFWNLHDGSFLSFFARELYGCRSEICGILRCGCSTASWFVSSSKRSVVIR